ncbi:MAG: histidinol-phosphate transaminase [Ruminococcaceae bacterium]|nr:histidinol-phosphate transaminase [Oscillospiraceae bacterium]
MSRFFSDKFAALTPYTPGEQPRERRYIKLNTNESPFPPSPRAVEAAAEAAERLQLYSDPTARALNEAMADLLGVEPDEILFTNGSDEILNFAFGAFCDDTCPAVFPDITYGFYPVFAEYNRVPYKVIPLKDDLTIDPTAYYGGGHTVVIANPNAPTGIPLSRCEIEGIVKANPDNVVVIDEAYVDFGAESAVPLIHKYDNLLVTGTFSKSRSMAGARLGFGVGCKALIQDLNTIKYATNPYNVNAMTMAAGVGMLADEEYTKNNCRTVAENREYTAKALRAMGFVLTDSRANFVFARHPQTDGGTIYRRLKERGILVRHFDTPRIDQFNRITIGTREEMDTLLAALREIIASNKSEL